MKRLMGNLLRKEMIQHHLIFMVNLKTSIHFYLILSIPLLQQYGRESILHWQEIMTCVNTLKSDLLNTLQFCTNPSKPLLIHDLVTDAVEICGGSRQLLRILNWLGCTSSPNTHDRYITQQANSQRSKSLWGDLSPAVFTVASVDKTCSCLLWESAA